MEATKKEIQAFIRDNRYVTNKKLMSVFKISTQRASANLIAFRKKNKQPANNENGAFNNENGNGKQRARNIIIKHILKSNLNKGKILTLPFSKCLVERQLLSALGKKIEFIGYERDTKTYWKMFRTIEKHKLPIYPILGEIGYELQTAHEDKYSHLILDYCCQLHTIIDDMKSLFIGNVVNVDGTIAITLNKRSATDKIFNQMNTLVKKENENELKTIHAIKIFFSKVCGFNYSIEEIFEYRDTASMVLIVIKRIK
jgi:hypothetical protein